MKIHLDTDIGGDMDDLCALVMLVKLPDIEITGITTVAEERGRRAGYVRHVLERMGRTDIPAAAGADVADGYYRYEALAYPPDEENWGMVIPPQPGPLDAALALLKHSIEQGATIVAMGQFTNLRLLDEQHPGILEQANLYLMGGFVYDVPPGFPRWERTHDWNVQSDVRSARYVLEHNHPTLIPITVTAQTALRRADIPRLAIVDRIGDLLARQAYYVARTDRYEQLYGATCEFLPDDIINFHHDPLTCAIATGWREGVTIEIVPLRLEVRDTILYEIPDEHGKSTRLVTSVDGAAFGRYWMDVVSGRSGECGGKAHPP